MTATNIINSSTLTSSVIQNLGAPILSQVSFSIAGTAGSTNAQPTLTWSNSGGTVSSYSLVVYGDINTSPTTVIATITSITSGQTSYYYTTTVANYYYKYVLTATNSINSSILTSSVIRNYGSSAWVQQVGIVSSYWKGIALSSDGTKVVAVNNYADYIWTSTDSGVTWTQQLGSNPDASYIGVVSSADGTKIAAVATDYIWTSTDSGVTWTRRDGGKWCGIASSTDGTNLVAIQAGLYTDNSPGYIYRSTDSGVTWAQLTGSILGMWISVASSSDGTKLAAVDSNTATLYISSDSGTTWTQQTQESMYFDGVLYTILGITMSADGTKLFAATSGYIIKSTNSGSTWTVATSVGMNIWVSIACSSDGSKIVASAQSDYVYISSDSGTTWIQQTALGVNSNTYSWTSVSCSANGLVFAAAAGYGSDYVYILNNSP